MTTDDSEPDWLDYVRTGWRVTDRKDRQGLYYCVRVGDGKTLEGRDTDDLINRMAVADIRQTHRRVYGSPL